MESLSRFAPHSIAFGIVCVAYGSQILYRYIEPGALTWKESLQLNSLVIATWICFARSCFVDPGRVPKGWRPNLPIEDGQNDVAALRRRWCQRCEAPKPPRAHHCKTCKRCIPKMDHHCPWTGNCVSNRTLPHFMRLLFFATVSMIYIESLLWTRVQVVWQNRNLPSYLGPSPFQLACLFMIWVANSFILFVVGILLLRSLSSLAMNTTTIEGWEIERHNVLLRRARALGGYLDGPDGKKIRITKQEFPYDIGIWSNITQGMGGVFLMWLFPFSPSPALHGGLEFPVNDFEEPSTLWPPPDPDRMVRRPIGDTTVFIDAKANDAERIANFRSRQAADVRRTKNITQTERRRPFHQRFEDPELSKSHVKELEHRWEGEESWRSSEGERLQDFGLDEEAEFYDEDEALGHHRELNTTLKSPKRNLIPD